MSPTRRRLSVLANVFTAVLITWFAVGIARDPNSEAARILLMSIAAAVFAGLALFDLWTLWRDERSPSAEA